MQHTVQTEGLSSVHNCVVQVPLYGLDLWNTRVNFHVLTQFPEEAEVIVVEILTEADRFVLCLLRRSTG